MRIKYYRINKGEREKILKKIKNFLEKDHEIILAFIHGSFRFNKPFRDIDIAVLLRDKEKAFEYTINKSVELEDEIGLPIDIHVLNDAPVTFRYHVVRNGTLLFTKNKAKLQEFIIKTLKEYWDFKTLMKHSIAKALSPRTSQTISHK